MRPMGRVGREMLEVALRLPDRINLRLDQLSMAHAIEAREIRAKHEVARG